MKITALHLICTVVKFHGSTATKSDAHYKFWPDFEVDSQSKSHWFLQNQCWFFYPFGHFPIVEQLHTRKDWLKMSDTAACDTVRHLSWAHWLRCGSRITHPQWKRHDAIRLYAVAMVTCVHGAVWMVMRWGKRGEGGTEMNNGEWESAENGNKKARDAE